MDMDMDQSGDYDAEYDSDEDTDSDSEISDDGTNAESNCELNSPDDDQVIETEQEYEANHGWDAERELDGQLWHHWTGLNNSYECGYFQGLWSDDDQPDRDDDDTEEPSDIPDNQDDPDDVEDSLHGEDELEDSDFDKLGIMPHQPKFTNDSSANYTAPHNDDIGESPDDAESDNWLKKLKRFFGIDEEDEDDFEDEPDKYY